MLPTDKSGQVGATLRWVREGTCYFKRRAPLTQDTHDNATLVHQSHNYVTLAHGTHDDVTVAHGSHDYITHKHGDPPAETPRTSTRVPPQRRHAQARGFPRIDATHKYGDPPQGRHANELEDLKLETM
jgi:hypothetical protein